MHKWLLFKYASDKNWIIYEDVPGQLGRPKVIAEIPQDKEGAREIAYLISAAPDLLEACKGLIEYRRRNTLNFQLEKADDFIRMMQIAIAKAEGGQQ